MFETSIRSALICRAVVTRSMSVAMAKALFICYPDIPGKIILDNSNWKKSLLRRINYTRRKGTTNKIGDTLCLAQES